MNYKPLDARTGRGSAMSSLGGGAASHKGSDMTPPRQPNAGLKFYDEPIPKDAITAKASDFGET